MGEKSDLLESRAAAALTLRDFDAAARQQGATLPRKLVLQRWLLVRNLEMAGGIAWDFDGTADNSWVP